MASRAAGLPVVFEFPSSGTLPARPVLARHGSTHIRFSLGTADPVAVVTRHALALAHLERFWASLRNGPSALTFRQTVALAGEVYRKFLDRHSDEPASRATWEAVKGLNRAAREGRTDRLPALSFDDVSGQPAVASALFGASEGAALTAGINGAPSSVPNDALEQRFGDLANYVLALHGLAIDRDSRRRLLVQIEAAATDAAKALKRHAVGDYTPDTAAARFPVFVAPVVTPPPPSATWESVFDAWSRRHATADKQPRTRGQYQRVMDRFVSFLDGKPPLAVTKADVQAYVEARLTGSPKIPSKKKPQAASLRTVRFQDLACIRAVFAAAMRDGTLPDGSDPTASVNLPVASSTSTRTGRRRGFADEEARSILAAAASETNPLFHWVPMILALTGARVAEVVALRACDVKTIDGVAAFSVTPDAGRHVKNGYSIRDVPLHPDIVAAGFLDFVKTKSGDERLFIRPRKSRKPATGHADTPVRTTCEKLRRWLHALPGLSVGKAVGLDPNHAWRHRVKTVGLDAGIDSRILDAIAGHRPASVGAGYGEVSMRAKATAIARLAVP